MGRPTTKADLMTAATNNYKKLNVLVSGLTEKELSTVFDFANDENGYMQIKRKMRNPLFQNRTTGKHTVI